MTWGRIEVGVIIARRKLRSPWADHAWIPRGVLPRIPAAEAWTPLGADEEEELFYAGACELTLHPSETSHYRDNLAARRPSLWVALRLDGNGGCGVTKVTANPYEGEALTEGIGGIVEAVPMPKEIQAKLVAFFERFHVERPFLKRERDRADPDILGRRPRARGRGGAGG